MNSDKKSKRFAISKDISWALMDKGVERKILCYNQELMMTNVRFEKGGIGKLHHHPHRQGSFIESRTFEVQIGAEKKHFKKEKVISWRQICFMVLQAWNKELF